MSKVANFTIDTAVAQAHRDEILEYVYNYYLLPKHDNFGFIKKSYESNGLNLSFTGFKLDEGWRVEITMKSGSPILVNMKWDDLTPDEFVDTIKEDSHNGCSILS